MPAICAAVEWSMHDLPEVILLAITKSEAVVLLDALSGWHRHTMNNALPDDSSDAYGALIMKISKELGDDESRPYLVKG